MKDEPYVVHGLASKLSGTTDGEGGVTIELPVHVRDVSIELPRKRLTYHVAAGNMDCVQEYELKVAEVPADETGFYRLEATSIRADNDTLSRYHVYYRKKPFSFAKLVRIDDYDGTPEHSPIWQQPANEAPHPEVHETFRFISDFPIMPDHPWLGESTYFSSFGRPLWVQKVERTADGLRFTVTLAGGGRQSVMDWKRGSPWWSSLGRFHRGYSSKPEMYFNGSGLLVE